MDRRIPLIQSAYYELEFLKLGFKYAYCEGFIDIVVNVSSYMIRLQEEFVYMLSNLIFSIFIFLDLI
jgi:hypothetical protein